MCSRSTCPESSLFRYHGPPRWKPARYVNAAFTAHEVEAITTAHPTPAAHDLTRTCPPAAATFVGDSVTDIEAARAAHTMSIGYTNKPNKTAELMTASADTVIPTPATLTRTDHVIFDQAPPNLGPYRAQPPVDGRSKPDTTGPNEDQPLTMLVLVRGRSRWCGG
jgi:hypothetical protein